MADQATNDLIDEVDSLPWGAARRAAAERLLAVAQDKGDQDLEWEARMRLTAEGVMSDVTELALTNFAWCIAKHKEDPARFTGDANSQAGTIFWHYKWMPGVLMRSPAFSKAQVDEVLADFEQTYRDASLPLSAVVGARFETAMGAKDLADAETWGAQLAQMPRDDFSSCEACTPANYVGLELLRGDHKATAELALKIWKSGKSCAEEPESLLASALVSMAIVGKRKKAIKAFTYVYEQCRNKSEQLGNAADCILFAAITGNEERALSMVERHLPWLAHDALGEAEHLRATRSFAVALSRLDHEGAGDIVVRGSADQRLATVLAPASAPRTVSELAAECWLVAERLTAAFDARNGNDGYAKELAFAKELVGTTYPIALPDQEGEAFRPLLVRRAAPTTPAEWLEKALDHRWAGEVELALEAATYAMPGLAGKELARAHQIQRSAAQQLGDAQLHAAATADWMTALESAYDPDTVAFAAATDGAVSLAQVESLVAQYPHAHAGFVGAAWGAAANSVLDGEPGEEELAAAAQLLEKAIDCLWSLDEDHARDRALASAMQFTAQIRAAQGEVADAIEALDEASELAPSRLVLAVLTDTKAQVYGRSEALDAAAALHDEAVALAAEAGHPSFAAEAAGHAGSAWSAIGEPGEAAARFAYALSLTPNGQQAPVGLRWRYAVAALEAEDADAAIPFLEQILAEEIAAGAEPGALADTHYHLGKAYDESYDPRAADEYLAASRLFAQAGVTGPAALAGLAAGRELHFQGRAVEAVEALRGGLDALDGSEEQAIRIDLLMGLGAALREARDENWQQPLDQAVAVAQADGETTALARTLLMRLSILDDHHDDPAIAERVIELADHATSCLTEVGDAGNAAATIHWKVTALSSLGRDQEAEALLAASARNESLLLDVRRGFASRLAESLLEAGRHEDAAQWKAYRKQLKG